MKDAIFYQTSGGGLTLSGGEPMAQFSFTRQLLTAAKARGLHTCLETCGFAPWEHFDGIRSLVDIFLFDYKLTVPALHKRYTGVTNEKILENLWKLDAAGAAVILRCPIIPGCNDTEEHFADIVALAKQYDNVKEVHLEPYHPLGISKLEQLGRAVTYDNRTFLDAHTLTARTEEMTALCGKTVRIS